MRYASTMKVMAGCVVNPRRILQSLVAQEEWEEEKDPEAFRLGGELPVAKADTPVDDGRTAGRSSAQAHHLTQRNPKLAIQLVNCPAHAPTTPPCARLPGFADTFDKLSKTT